MRATKLQCKECGWQCQAEAFYACCNCFGPLEVIYPPRTCVDVGELRRRILVGPHSIWRYRDFLPVDRGFACGYTPLIRADALAAHLGLREVWIKNDTANPTHSFKDRVVAVAAARARELGFNVLACASTGNLANAVAAQAAALGMESYVFIPADLEEAKVVGTSIYGGNVVSVRGSYDEVNRLCTEISGEHEDWAFVNINLRPYYAEGSKTVAYEIMEQLGWELPDRCIIPIASGSLFTKIGRGFDEWRDLGLVEGSLPTMNGAQARGCAPVAIAYAEGSSVCQPVKPDTIAKSLAIGNPADGPYALALARTSGGSVTSVSDAQVKEGINLLARTTGVFAETAGGVAVAALCDLAADGAIGADERVVIVITGDGLKTLDATRGSSEITEINPTLEAFEASGHRS